MSNQQPHSESAVSPDHLQEITRRIVEHFNPRRILVFGSYARGETGPNSDVDLFIEMESDQRPPQRAAEVAAIFGLRHWPMDVIVYTPEEVAQLQSVHGTLLSMIKREGRVLYERDCIQPHQ